MNQGPNEHFQERTSGVLLHPTSLPGPHGNGDLGPEAYRFVDFLAKAGQRWWQMLPVGPPGRAPGYSPYSSLSAFAGNASLISLELLRREGLLTSEDVEPIEGLDSKRVQFSVAWKYRRQRLRLAFERYYVRPRLHQDLEEFCRRERGWLDDYVLFCALKKANAGKDWGRWNKASRLRDAAALQEARRVHADEIALEQFVQYQFDRQWKALKNYCAQKGIGLIGDIPIFVAYDSSEVWAHRELFLLRADGRPSLVSGCPPDSFAHDGQKWDHPHYRWEAHKASNFAWWVARFAATLRNFDAVRIDHFLGFDRFWAIPAKSKTARHGKWMRGPGKELFDAVLREQPNAAIIAEDLGLLTPSAAKLRDDLGFPGMRLMQCGFGPGGQYHLPHEMPAHCVAYTGTHDNNTVVGWFKSLGGKNGNGNRGHQLEQAKALAYLKSDGRELHWDMIRSLMGSVAKTVIVPVQDILGLGEEDRMNIPGKATGNWNWRLKEKSLTPRIAARLAGLCELFDRKRPEQKI